MRDTKDIIDELTAKDVKLSIGGMLTLTQNRANVAGAQFHRDHLALLHHLGDFADRSALQLLNDAAPHPVSERTKRLPDIRNFARDSGSRSAPDHGLSR